MKKTLFVLSLLSLSISAFSQTKVKAFTKVDNPELTALPSSQVLRVEADVSASWKGVDGCCDDGTPAREVDAAFVKWVKDQLYQHSNLKLIRYGHNETTAQCSKTKDPWPSNARHCHGAATVKSYIEFANQK